MDPATGKMIAPPGTVEALQKYVELKPDGTNAESAKALISALGGSVQTKYTDPNAPPAKGARIKTTRHCSKQCATFVACPGGQDTLRPRRSRRR